MDPWIALKRLASRLPTATQQELHRIHHGWELHRGRFSSEEPEFALLDALIAPGDWVLDVGANVGRYTLRMSELVGPAGHVLAFEPIPETFELLAVNVRRAPLANVTLFATAASDATALCAMDVPRWSDGRPNFYMAGIRDGGKRRVLGLPVDALDLPCAVSFVKIDAEGHELAVLRGMQRLIARDHPLLMIEESSEAILAWAGAEGLARVRLPGSPNLLVARAGTAAGKRLAALGVPHA